MKKGFTLLELLIVVVILGVLALIAAPALLNAADQAKEGAVKANVSAAASTITSQFALNSTKTATQVAADVVTSLSANNTNPINSANNAFSTSATTAGTVALTASGTNVTINGYGKTGGTSIITKVLSPPASN